MQLQISEIKIVLWENFVLPKKMKTSNDSIDPWALHYHTLFTHEQ